MPALDEPSISGEVFAPLPEELPAASELAVPQEGPASDEAGVLPGVPTGTLDELRELLAPIHDLPKLLDEKLASDRDREILEQLGHLSRDIHRLSQRPASTEDGESAWGRQGENPEQPKVPLDDIQKMIEFLK